MKKKLIILVLLSSVSLSLVAQTKIYYTSCFEFLFQSGQITKDNTNLDQSMRFTLWFNYTHQAHLDLNDNIGFYSGVSIRNIGFITNNEKIKFDNTEIDKIKRRMYTVGIPLAIKIGSFDKNFYLYGGGEAALAIGYKEKRFENGVKTKKTSFLGKETNLFQPSVFAGIQFPRGLNVQYRLYLNNMLDKNYGAGTAYDQSEFSKSILQCISLCFNIEKKDWKRYGFNYSTNHDSSIKSM